MGTVGAETIEAVRVHNPEGSSPYLLVCDHASNFLPAEFGTLGLPAGELERHIAWDPGALPVSLHLSQALDATLVQSCISRLVIDCNRPLDAPNLFWSVSEDTVVPGNQDLDGAQRQRRIDLAYHPYHDAIDRVVRARLAAGRRCWIVSIHSFTPVYLGERRPWEIGVVHDADERLSAPLIEALRREAGLNVGVNEPYSPADKVYFTLERHARSRGLACVMIEIRNDEIADAVGQREWGARLARILDSVTEAMESPEMAGKRAANG